MKEFLNSKLGFVCLLAVIILLLPLILSIYIRYALWINPFN